jgi:hypothetical protein
VLLITIFTVLIIAQRKSPLNQEQLNLALKRGKIMKRTGAAIFISGFVLDGIGVILLDRRKVIGTDMWGGNRYEKNGGGWCLLAGIATTAVGIPKWITGATKKNIDNKLATFKVSASETGIGLKIGF